MNSALPFGGYGSPCGNLPLQQRRAVAHAHDRRNLPAVQVREGDLDGCRECDMCGGCEEHEGCLTDLGHIEWRMRFASPGEPTCGIAHAGQTCALVADHSSEWHQNPQGNGWQATS